MKNGMWASELRTTRSGGCPCYLRQSTQIHESGGACGARTNNETDDQVCARTCRQGMLLGMSFSHTGMMFSALMQFEQSETTEFESCIKGGGDQGSSRH